MQRNAQRRRHKKSRGGCSQCKRRHVKCDEGRPSCSNCTVSELRCVYAAGLSADPDNEPSLTIPENGITSRYRSTTSTPALQTPVQTPSQPGEPVPDAQTDNPPESGDLFTVNIEHLKLFNHAMEHDLVYTKHSDATDLGTLTKSMIRYALSTPYLAQQVLSIAALHLSLSDSSQREHYRRQAQGLQTRALSLFNSVQPVVNAETCIPMLMFSSFVGLHVLCDTVNFGVTDPDKFLDGFARYINLHRGVRAVTNQSWHYLRSTDLAPVVEAAEMNARAADLQGEECADLRALVAFSDTGQSSKQAYSDAIDRLQAIFDAERRQGPSEFVFSWPVLISPEYTELIMQRRPEALLILSYYAVLLHRQRSYWLVGRAGKLLLAAINAHLGTYWQSYLAWPAAAIAGDP